MFSANFDGNLAGFFIGDNVMMLAVKNKILLESGDVECVLKKCIDHAVFDMMYHAEFEKLGYFNSKS